MNITHYMALLMDNQPWNLIIFMAIPVILAEYIAVTTLFILLRRDLTGFLKLSNRVAGIIIGIYFLGVFLYLMVNAVIPLTAGGQWRGIADIIAVGFYLLGIVPLLGISLLELRLPWLSGDETHNLKLHTAFVALFLVVAHIAMIFGMLDPTILAPAQSGGMKM